MPSLRLLPSTRRDFLRLFAILAASVFVVPFIVAWRVGAPKNHPVGAPPTVFKVPAESFTAAAEDGVPISGWYFAGEPDRPVVVFCHGVGADRTQMVDHAVLAAGHKTGIVLFDFRGHGESGASGLSPLSSLEWLPNPIIVTIGGREILDIRAVVGWLRAKNPQVRVVLWGLSMGASAALIAAPDTPGVVGVIAESPFDSLTATLEHHARLYAHLPGWPFGDLTAYFLGLLGGFDPDAVSPIEAVKRAGAVPMLFIAGKQDRRMPPDLVKSIADAHPGRTVFLAVPGQHAWIFDYGGRRYPAAAAEFIESLK